MSVASLRPNAGRFWRKYLTGSSPASGRKERDRLAIVHDGAQAVAVENIAAVQQNNRSALDAAVVVQQFEQKRFARLFDDHRLDAAQQVFD